MIANKYNCTLPWANNATYEFCPIMDENRNQTYSQIVEVWHDAFTIHEESCPKWPKCKRSLYNLESLSTEEWDYSTLQIKLKSPNVLNIADSYSYDIHLFIGEVGGTLGLFLGLSMFSIVEFIEYILRKLCNKRF